MAAMLVCGRESVVVAVGAEGTRGAWEGRRRYPWSDFVSGGGGGCALDVSYYNHRSRGVAEMLCTCNWCCKFVVQETKI
jgi:hypothetical protein